MANLEYDVILAIIGKTFIIGLLAFAGGWWFAGGSIALAIGVGAIVAAANLYFVAWLIEKVIGDDGKGVVGKGGYMILSTIKMTLLFGLVWFLIARLGLSAVGFAIGFSCFLPAMVWQALVSFDVDTSDSDA
jgi:hypothetical protein